MYYLKKLIADHFTQDYSNRYNIIDCKQKKTCVPKNNQINYQTAANIGLQQVAGQI